MSNSKLKTLMAIPMLSKLNNKLEGQLKAIKGQLLILNSSAELKKTVELVTGVKDSGSKEGQNTNAKRDKGAYQSALNAGKRKARELSDDYKIKDANRYAILSAKHEDLGLPPNLIFYDGRNGREANVFLVKSFRKDLSEVKKAMADVLEEKGILSDTQKQKFIDVGLDKGHGAQGLAISQARIASAAGRLNTKQRGNLVNILDSQVASGSISKKDGDLLKKLVINAYQQVDTRGNLRADYLAVMSFQNRDDNRRVDAKEEKRLLAVFRKIVTTFSDEIFEMKGSSTLKDKITAIALMNLAPKGARVTSKAKNAKLKTKSKAEAKAKENKNKAKTSIVPFKKGKAGRRTVQRDRTSIVNLMGILSNKINDTVAKNMKAPALVYRDGDFAKSVEITDIATTPQGFPSIGYTYQKYPYQTFEPGYVQGSTERDPRRLIDASIREIAMGLAIGRFYTRRV